MDTIITRSFHWCLEGKMVNSEKHGHTVPKSGAGSHWSNDINPCISSHEAFSLSLFHPSQYHVIVKYAYAKAFIRNDDDKNYWRQLYEKMQIKRIGVAKTVAFDALISSIRESGFKKQYPIPISRQGLILLDGSHRLGTCLALGIWPTVEIYDALPHPYDKNWFVENDFSPSELHSIDVIKDELVDCFSLTKHNLGCVVIWGNALDYWDEIIEEFRRHNLRAGMQFDLGSSAMTESFVMASYADDGMDEEKISTKAHRLANMSTLIGLLVYTTGTKDDISSTKKIVRAKISPKVSEYFFDSILHTVDSEMVLRRIIREYFKP